jgi:hypothetical protein
MIHRLFDGSLIIRAPSSDSCSVKMNGTAGLQKHFSANDGKGLTGSVFGIK